MTADCFFSFFFFSFTAVYAYFCVCVCVFCWWVGVDWLDLLRKRTFNYPLLSGTDLICFHAVQSRPNTVVYRCSYSRKRSTSAKVSCYHIDLGCMHKDSWGNCNVLTKCDIPELLDSVFSIMYAKITILPNLKLQNTLKTVTFLLLMYSSIKEWKEKINWQSLILIL